MAIENGQDRQERIGKKNDPEMYFKSVILQHTN